MVQAIPEHLATTPVRLGLFGRDGRPLPEQDLSWIDLIGLRATRHLPGHAARLAAAASATASRTVDVTG
ncbi:hypothetical protein [Sphaerisporangium fuscum]|uniref:hypothetical protein n=1 Tax=Sphaerisporangium fuscum TaxID=2835868 RepID=UPI001BDC6C71|nr:hypothetical protein [Sphaerisporangium fuscum]